MVRRVVGIRSATTTIVNLEGSSMSAQSPETGARLPDLSEV
jgi:hypothetical protein